MLDMRFKIVIVRFENSVSDNSNWARLIIFLENVIQRLGEKRRTTFMYHQLRNSIMLYL